jgi:SAM-dependent methyltransferase
MSMPAQDVRSAEQNSSFFAGNQKYARMVAGLATYRNIREAVNESIAGRKRLLDIGNGGVFDYDTELAGEIVGVDLFLDGEGLVTPPNVTLRRGDALDLDEPDAAYDGVLIVLVLHHLVSSTVDGTVENIRKAIAEARRVLEPGGKLILVESCVSTRAYSVIRHLFAPLRLLAASPLMDHPPTLQFPADEIQRLLREHFADVHVRRIPTGRVLLQFGRRWPTVLTPARPYLFTAG